MKKKLETKLEDDLRAEYDFYKLKGGVRGKYAKQFHAGTNLVLLEPDIAKVFPNDDAVNEALRQLIKIAKARVGHAN
ncbi:MAG: hypothetical protein C4526_05410 [Nitrospiraceae bacterium]|nr:MAG: hypothetical protein C4526_05410 [Nitrospiraceae bacterium]